MNRIKITRENGGLGRTSANKDGVTGLLFYVPAAAKAALAGAAGSAFAGGDMAVMGSMDDVDRSGLKGSTNWHLKLMYHHLKILYSQNAEARVWVMVKDKDTNHADYGDIATMQQLAEGEMRMVGVWEGGVPPTAAHVRAMQAVATQLEADQMPLSIVWSCGGSKAQLLGLNLRQAGQRNVSVSIGQDGDDGLWNDSGNTDGESTGMVGLLLGLLSKAPVNESVAWVDKYPTGVANPCLADGTPMREVGTGEAATLDEKGYLMLVTYPGIAGSYVSDTHTMDEATSDYAHMEDERTMDKAVRGVYASLVRTLGGTVYANPDGSLREDSRAMMESKASETLDQMERAGELSGYSVEVSGDQVLRDGTVSVAIKNQATGVVRELKVSVGYAATLE